MVGISFRVRVRILHVWHPHLHIHILTVAYGVYTVTFSINHAPAALATHRLRTVRSASTYWLSVSTNFCSLEVVHSSCKMWTSNCFAPSKRCFVVYLVLLALWDGRCVLLTPVCDDASSLNSTRHAKLVFTARYATYLYRTSSGSQFQLCMSGVGL